MLKKIQNKLLLNHPILWNLRLVPMMVILLSLNLIAFILGLMIGDININTDFSYAYDESTTFITVIFLSITIILLLIGWFMVYNKNNAFKNNYPLTARQLFQEWAGIFCITLMMASVFVVFFYGKDFTKRMELSRSKLELQTEIITKASNFTTSSINLELMESQFNTTTELYSQVYNPVFEYRNRLIPKESYFNKTQIRFYNQDFEKDSIISVEIKELLFDKKEKEIKVIMQNAIDLIDSYKLDHNLTADKWYQLIHTSDNYEIKTIISDRDKDYYMHDIKGHVNLDHEYYRTEEKSFYDNLKKDTLTYYKAKVNNDLVFKYNHYINLKHTSDYLDEIAEAYTNPVVTLDFISIFGYVAFVLSTLVFSLRITNIRKVVISSLAVGILLLISSIFAIGSDVGLVILVLFLSYFTALLTYVMTKSNRLKSTKGKSAYAWNIVLWSFVFVIPAIMAIIVEICRKSLDVGTYFDEYTTPKQQENALFIKNLEAISHLLMHCNLIICIIVIYFLIKKIRLWKALPEN